MGGGWHGRSEKWSYLISFTIALVAFGVGVTEPFKTENQLLAEQRFALFKQNRQAKFTLAAACNPTRLAADLRTLRGIRSTSVVVDTHSISLTYQKNQISEADILTFLKTAGYQVMQEK